MTGRQVLDDLIQVIEQYESSVSADFTDIPDDVIWRRPVPEMVSPANLVLHLAGNLSHFMGRHLGGTDYVRDRDREFGMTGGLSKPEVLAAWRSATGSAASALRKLDASRLEEPAPVDTFPGGAPVHLFLTRLVAHLAYHAGQIRMLRRLLDPTPRRSETQSSTR